MRRGLEGEIQEQEQEEVKVKRGNWREGTKTETRTRETERERDSKATSGRERKKGGAVEIRWGSVEINKRATNFHFTGYPGLPGLPGFWVMLERVLLLCWDDS